jgi:hypothetical protein
MEKGKKTFGLQCLYNYGPIKKGPSLFSNTNPFGSKYPVESEPLCHPFGFFQIAFSALV